MFWIIFQNIEVDMDSILSYFLYFTIIVGNELITIIPDGMLSHKTDNKPSFNWVVSLPMNVGSSFSLNNKVAASFQCNWLIIKENKKSDISNKSTFQSAFYSYDRVWIFSSYWNHSMIGG